ncbi:MAG: hypothetical protein R2839_03840 [Thermomicrobiales bacterium]
MSAKHRSFPVKHRLLNSHCCLRISLAIVTICGSGLIWFSSVEAVQESAPGPGDYEEQLEIDGRMRTFDVHVPAGVDSSQDCPCSSPCMAGRQRSLHGAEVRVFRPGR